MVDLIWIHVLNVIIILLRNVIYLRDLTVDEMTLNSVMESSISLNGEQECDTNRVELDMYVCTWIMCFKYFMQYCPSTASLNLWNEIWSCTSNLKEWLFLEKRGKRLEFFFFFYFLSAYNVAYKSCSYS